MSKRELILLSPYRVPAKDSLMLNDEDVAAFLNGYMALWHPAVALGAADPPQVASQYDYENPVEGHIYAVPESPPMFLPEDWDQRVRHIGAAAFRAGTDRAATLDYLKTALKALEEREHELAAERGPLTPDPSPQRGEGSDVPLTPDPSPQRGEGRLRNSSTCLPKRSPRSSASGLASCTSMPSSRRWITTTCSTFPACGRTCSRRSRRCSATMPRRVRGTSKPWPID